MRAESVAVAAVLDTLAKCRSGWARMNRESLEAELETWAALPEPDLVRTAAIAIFMLEQTGGKG